MKRKSNHKNSKNTKKKPKKKSIVPQVVGGILGAGAIIGASALLYKYLKKEKVLVIDLFNLLVNPKDLENHPLIKEHENENNIIDFKKIGEGKIPEAALNFDKCDKVIIVLDNKEIIDALIRMVQNGPLNFYEHLEKEGGDGKIIGTFFDRIANTVKSVNANDNLKKVASDIINNIPSLMLVYKQYSEQVLKLDENINAAIFAHEPLGDAIMARKAALEVFEMQVVNYLLRKINSYYVYDITDKKLDRFIDLLKN